MQTQVTWIPLLCRQQWFVGTRFDARKVVVLAHKHKGSASAAPVQPPKALISYPLFETNPDTPAAVRDALDNLLDAANR